MKKISLITVSFFLLAYLCQGETLTQKAIEKWISAYPKVNEWMEEHEDDVYPQEDHLEDGTVDEMMQAGFNALKGHKLYKDFEKMIKPLGYKSGEALFADTINIVQTFMAITVKQEMEKNGMGDMMAKLKEIDDMPGIDDAQKAMFKQQLGAAFEQVKGMVAMTENVNPDNIKALTPYIDKIKTIMDQ